MTLQFDSLEAIDQERIPELESYTARDGTDLNYRMYPSSADRVFVCIHGSGGESRYLQPLGSALSEADVATVVTPDLRGHGSDPVRRGDVDYVGQLEDDVADLVEMLREEYPSASIVVGGHSSGGGLVIRLIGGEHGQIADGYVLIAPYLGHDAPTTRPGSGGWAEPYLFRLVALSILNEFGVDWFNGTTVIRFNMPEEVRDGMETLSYTYRLNTSFAPRDYQKDLDDLTTPALLVVGSNDEAFLPTEYEPIFEPISGVSVEMVSDATHFSVVTEDRHFEPLVHWLTELDETLGAK